MNDATGNGSAVVGLIQLKLFMDSVDGVTIEGDFG